MQKILLIFFLSVITSFTLKAQQPVSADLIAKGIELHDEGKYQQAIDTYKQVNENDSLYSYMLSELSLTFMKMEEYDSTIFYINKGLELKTDTRKHLLQTLATTYDDAGYPDIAIKTYKEAIEKYPYSYLLHFNLGITYNAQGEFEKAAECYKNALRCNPFHPTSHLQLGKLMARQKLYSKAIISLETFLALEPRSDRSNYVLLYIENISENYLDTSWGEYLEPFTDNELFEEVDHLIKSGIALDKKFKTKIKFDASLVNQTVLLLQSLPYDTKSDDFWAKLYFPFFKAINEEGHIKPFIYTILGSTGHEAVVKYTKKKQKDIDKFFETGSYLSLIKKTRYANLDGEEKLYSCSYYDNGTIFTVGNVNLAGKEDGYWKIYFPNGEPRAEGLFKDGLKNGEWKYYYETGDISSIENLVDDKLEGLYKSFHQETGKLKTMYSWKNDEVWGDVSWYDKFGFKTAVNKFEKTLREGPAQTFYTTSNPKDSFNYKNNELDGKYLSFHPNGKLSVIQEYKAGKDEGPVISYYSNGKIGTSGNYKNGEREGKWVDYYKNGQIETETTFSAGKQIGDEKSFHSTGVLYSTASYNIEGKIHGVKKYHNLNGNLYLEEEYKDGIIIKVSSIDKDGKYHSVSGNSRGTFEFETFDENRAKISSGAFKSGKRNGVWTYFHRNGKVKKTIKYKNGDIVGELKSFHKNGTLSSIYNYVDGVNTGQYVGFNANGTLVTMGNLKEGNRDGEWNYYLPSGKLSQKAYFVEDELNGWLIDYSIDGKVMNRFKYIDDRLHILNDFDPDGYITTNVNFMDTNLLERYSTKNIKIAEVTNVGGKYEGEYIWYHPNGKISSSKSFMDGEADGKYTRYFSDGNIRTEGNYSYGYKEGKWTTYYKNGNPSSVKYYLDNDLDSVLTYYFEDGKVNNTITYYQGDKEGKEIFYDVTGELVIQLNYLHDEIISYQYNKNNELCDPIKIETGDQTITAYYNNGTKSYVQYFKNFVPDGERIIYFTNGNVRVTKSYKNGIIDGKYQSYWVNGNPKTEYFCTNGLYQETYRDYWKSGKLKLEIEYLDDARMGENRIYDKQGKLISTELYWSDRFIGYKE